MSRPYPAIPVEQHELILREQVLQRADFLDASEQSTPRAIVLAGQPGSGKGRLVRAAEVEFQGDGVVVDPDELRRHHPRFHALQREFPYTWSGQTHADASQ